MGLAVISQPRNTIYMALKYTVHERLLSAKNILTTGFSGVVTATTGTRGCGVAGWIIGILVMGGGWGTGWGTRGWTGTGAGAGGAGAGIGRGNGIGRGKGMNWVLGARVGEGVPLKWNYFKKCYTTTQIVLFTNSYLWWLWKLFR